MSTGSGVARHLVFVTSIVAATLAFGPGSAMAQTQNQPAAPPAAAPVAEGPGWLGVSMAEVTPEKASEVKLNDVHGALITGITANSPAAKAGLAGGDIILEFRGERVEGTLQLARLVRETPPGRTTKLTVWRDGRSREFSVEVGRAPDFFSWDNVPPDIQERLRELRDRLQRRMGRNAPPPSGAPPGAPAPQGPRGQNGAAGAPVLGIAAQDVSGQLADYLKVPESAGVLVTEVRSGSAAEKGGLHAGDVIIAVDGQRVRNTTELRAQVRPTDQVRMVALRVIRDGAETMLNVEIAPRQGPRARAMQRQIPI